MIIYYTTMKKMEHFYLFLLKMIGFFLNPERKILFNHAKLQHDGTDTKLASYTNSRRQSQRIKKHP